MNKLVIVGNGFDLAHGLPTSYKHFIDDFWRNLRANFQREDIKDLVFLNKGFTSLLEGENFNFTTFLRNIENESNRYGFHFNKKNFKLTTKDNYGENITIFEFKNDFFKTINLHSIDDWVDIEHEYY
ncbi:MAG: AbiH family protein, partial [Bacteroidota bacterium]